MSKYPKVSIGVGAVVIKNNKQVLLIKRIRGKKGWAIPGGYVEKNEKIFETVVREIKEETNLDIIPAGVIGVRQRLTDEEGHNIWLLVLANYQSGKVDPDFNEISNANFFNLTELENLELTDSTRVILNKLKNKKTSLLKVVEKISHNNYTLFI